MPRPTSRQTNSPALIARSYVRVSSIGDRGEGSASGREFMSPEIQLDAGRAYATLHTAVFDEESSRKHQDLDVTGFRKSWRKRPGLMAHLEAAERGEINLLIVYKLSRLARNAREGLEIFDAFEKAGCRIAVVKEGIDTSTAVGRLVRTILLAVAEMQSEDTAQFSRDASLKRAKGGKQHGPYPAWITVHTDGSKSINEDIAPSLRRLVALCSDGKSLISACNQLNKEGHRTPKGLLWTSVTAKRYTSEDTVLRMLGCSVYGRNRADDDLYRVVTQDAWPAIITEEEAAALRLARETAIAAYAAEVESGTRPGLNGYGGKRANSTSYILAGLAYCGVCGERLKSAHSGTGGAKQYRSYHCPAASSGQGAHAKPDNAGQPDSDAPTWINANMIETAVRQAISKALEIEDAAEAAQKEVPTKRRFKPATESLDIDKIEKELASLFELHSEGILRTADFKKRYDKLIKDREEAVAAARGAEVSQIRERARELLSRVSEDEESDKAALAQVIRLMLQRIEAPVTPGHKARPSDKHPLRYARVIFRDPLSDGTTSMLSPLFRKTYTGDRMFLWENASSTNTLSTDV